MGWARNGGRDCSLTVWGIFWNYVVIGCRT